MSEGLAMICTRCAEGVSGCKRYIERVGLPGERRAYYRIRP